MYTLKNELLDVSILDPVADQARFGTRYCTGGYIFQISDAQRGPLLTGPTYPDSFNWFDGQGIPDAFNLGPLYDPKAPSATALIIGVGMCDLAANTVTTFCDWDVRQEASDVQMRTEQQFASYSFTLERSVTLHGRTVRSTTRLYNTGRSPVPIRWFPHPFYPQPDGDELCRFNIPVRFPESEHYALAPSGFIARKQWPWPQQGPYQAFDHDAQTNLVIVQKHPMLGLVAATCSYVPALLPVWGNTCTFSWEPFFERTLAAGQETAWWIDYEF